MNRQDLSNNFRESFFALVLKTPSNYMPTPCIDLLRAAA
jgi:hypothetical protein